MNTLHSSVPDVEDILWVFSTTMAEVHLFYLYPQLFMVMRVLSRCGKSLVPLHHADKYLINHYMHHSMLQWIASSWSVWVLKRVLRDNSSTGDIGIQVEELHLVTGADKFLGQKWNCFPVNVFRKKATKMLTTHLCSVNILQREQAIPADHW